VRWLVDRPQSLDRRSAGSLHCDDLVEHRAGGGGNTVQEGRAGKRKIELRLAHAFRSAADEDVGLHSGLSSPQMGVTVIIPALNEEDWIAGAVESAAGSEVIVVDGGSTDRTSRFATAAGARVLLCEPMRARQLNRGAEVARGDFLIFLHADSRLPAGFAQAVEESGVLFGGFRIRFAEDDRRLRIAEKMINFRTAITRQPWGDQAQFVVRSAFSGFRDIPIMEDYELARRMRKGARILPLTVTTSGRRFLKKGLLRTVAINWTTIVRYRLGAEPNDLARAYRS